uniref:Uncharacterized protein n=1 Tax=Rhizophora mucronata TaxID=61149 RepID=A0A2P2N6D5_RHIMU
MSASDPTGSVAFLQAICGTLFDLLKILSYCLTWSIFVHYLLQL